MKRFILFIVLALSLVACSACTKKVPTPVVSGATPVVDAGINVPDAASPVVPVNNTFSFQNMEVMLPDNSWSQRELSSEVAMASNKDQSALVFLIKESTDLSLEGYVLQTIRENKQFGVTINSVKLNEINGHKYALIESTREVNFIYSWVTVKDKAGYCLSCSSESDKKSLNLCSQLITTLKIN